ncbi:MAG: type IX secretion system protein PorQ [Tannerella sp.]|nr:type IX secretion system protein PorQ [Tannerella sp.]
MKYIRLTACLLAVPCLLSAQEGGEVFTFLRYPTSSHVNALGGYTVSLIERDPSLIFHNPALLGGETDGMVNLNYMNYIAGIHTGSAVYTKAFRERGAWGIGARFFSYGSMKEVDASHTVLGNFSANDLSINVFYSHDLSEQWRGGVSFGMLYSGLAEYTSFGIAVDAGLSYFDPDKGISYGFALKNIGAQLKTYDGKREKLPWDIQLGLTKKMEHAPLRFSMTAVYLNRWKFNYADASLKETKLNENFFRTAVKHFVFGVDFIPSENFWAGIGYNPKMSADMQLKEGGNRLGGFSAGAGLRVSRFDLNVSAARYHPSAISLMLSVSVSLSDAVL